MRFVNIRELHQKTPGVIASASRGENFIVTKNGKPQALLLPLHEDEIEDIVFSSPAFLRSLGASRREYRRKGGITLEEARKRLSNGLRR